MMYKYSILYVDYMYFLYFINIYNEFNIYMFNRISIIVSNVFN